MLERECEECKTVIVQRPHNQSHPFIPPRSPSRHRLMGLPTALFLARPHCRATLRTTLPICLQANLSTYRPDRASHRPNIGLREEKMLLTGLCNRLVVMSTRVSVKFPTFRLASFRSMFRSAPHKTAPTCGLRSEVLHTDAEQPSVTLPPRRATRPRAR